MTDGGFFPRPPAQRPLEPTFILVLGTCLRQAPTRRQGDLLHSQILRLALVLRREKSTVRRGQGGSLPEPNPYVVPGRARTNPCPPYSPPELRNRSRSRSPLRRGAPAGQTRSAYAPSPCGSLAYAAQTGSALSPRRDCSLPTRVLPFAHSLSAPKAEI